MKYLALRHNFKAAKVVSGLVVRIQSASHHNPTVLMSFHLSIGMKMVILAKTGAQT